MKVRVIRYMCCEFLFIDGEQKLVRVDPWRISQADILAALGVKYKFEDFDTMGLNMDRMNPQQLQKFKSERAILKPIPIDWGFPGTTPAGFSDRKV